jgi:superfamily I DNA and/or RNA helicase
MMANGAQGKEKDSIIFSGVRDREDLGFLNSERRLNVGLSQAEEALRNF